MSISKKLISSIVLSLIYPSGMLTTIIYMSINGYIDIKESQNGLFLVLVVSLVLSIIVAKLITNDIILLFKKITTASKMILDGDLTKRIELESKNEIGEIINSFNTLIDYFVETLERIQSAGIVIKESSLNISSVAQESNAINGVLLTNSRNISNNSIDVLKNINDVYDKSVEMSKKSSEVFEFSEKLHADSQNIYISIKNGKESIKAMSNAIDIVVNNANMTNKAIHFLIDKTKIIEDILDIINSISEQTNLLAINSAIEAARAGAEGKGFAVLSGEIRSLAMSSNNETKNIDSLIKDIFAESGNSMMELKLLIDNIHNIKNEVSTVLSQFEQISENISSFVDISENMNENSKSQDLLSNNMKKEMEMSTNLIKDISEQVKNSYDNLNDQTTSSGELAEATANLSNMITDINEYISKYKI
jgi:methyl-accepting chemotaxis protein